MSDHFLTARVLPSLRASISVATPDLLGTSLQSLDFPPPSYAKATEIPRLSYIDIPPRCTSEGGILTPPVFERFNQLVARANGWLKNHPDVAVRSLETVDYETNCATLGRSVDTTVVSRFRHGQHGVIALKVLRMWIGTRDADDAVGAQQLGYLNIFPACVDPGGIAHKPCFESLDVTIDKLNAAFALKPLPGNIISIERIWMKFRQHCQWVDADRCHFHDRYEVPTCRLYGIRIFYETGLEIPTIIGFQDFLPVLKSSSKKITETFTGLVEQANTWISQNPGLLVTNFQTLYCGVKLPHLPDLNKALTVSYQSPDLIQVLRIWFQQFPSQTISDFMPVSRRCHSLKLYCRTFCPSLCDTTWRNIYVASQYESLVDVKQKIADWLLEDSDLHLISAETSGLKIDISGKISDGENTFVSSSYGDSQSWIRVLRVYYEASPKRENYETDMETAPFTSPVDSS